MLVKIFLSFVLAFLDDTKEPVPPPTPIFLKTFYPVCTTVQASQAGYATAKLKEDAAFKKQNLCSDPGCNCCSCLRFLNLLFFSKQDLKSVFFQGFFKRGKP